MANDKDADYVLRHYSNLSSQRNKAFVGPDKCNPLRQVPFSLGAHGSPSTIRIPADSVFKNEYSINISGSAGSMGGGGADKGHRWVDMPTWGTVLGTAIEDFTVSMWCKLTGAAHGQYGSAADTHAWGSLFSYNHRANYGIYPCRFNIQMRPNAYHEHLSIKVNGAAGDHPSTGWYYDIPFGDPTASYGRGLDAWNRWFHVAVSVNIDASLHIYVNGMSSSVPYSGRGMSSGSLSGSYTLDWGLHGGFTNWHGVPMMIGAQSDEYREGNPYNPADAPSSFFCGQITEFSMWNKALSTVEVLEMYDGTSLTDGKATDLSKHSAASSLKCWYRMGDHIDDDGTHMEDASGNGNHGSVGTGSCSSITKDVPPG